MIKRPAVIAPVSSAPRLREDLTPAMRSKAEGECPVIPYEEFIALPAGNLNSHIWWDFQVGLYSFAAMLFEVIREHRAFSGLNGMDLKGRPLAVNEARPRTDRPRTGGFGGRY